MPVLAVQPGAVQNAYVGYQNFNISGNSTITLIWPTSYQDSSNTVSMYMEFTGNTGGTTPNIILPDATQASVGQNFIIFNNTNTTINICRSDLTVITPIVNTDPEPGEGGNVVYFILTDNSTSAGVWEWVFFGAGVANVTPSALAGYGLNAYNNLLNTQTLISTQTTDYTVQFTDYTKMIVWTGGSGTFTLPAVTSIVPAPSPPSALGGDVFGGFFVSLNNAGSGNITINVNDGTGVQGVTTFNVTPGQTLTFIAVTTPITINGIPNNWFTLGYGQQSASNFNTFTINYSDTTGSVFNVTSAIANASFVFLCAEASSPPTPPYTLQFANGVLGEWWVNNDTEQTINVKTVAQTTDIVSVPAGQRMIFYGDGPGNRMWNYPTGLAVTSVELTSGADGLVIHPSGPQTGDVSISVNLPDGGTLTEGYVLTLAANGSPVQATWQEPTASGVVSLVTSSNSLALTPSTVSTGAITVTAELPDTDATTIGQVLAIDTVTPNLTAHWIDIPSQFPTGATNIGQPLTVLTTSPLTTQWSPWVYLTSVSVVPTSPSNSNDAIIFDFDGQPACASQNSNFSGALVTANNNPGGAQTAGITNLASGTLTINSSAIFGTSVILINTIGAPDVSKAVSVSSISSGTFTVDSTDSSDTRPVHWMIVNPAFV